MTSAPTTMPARTGELAAEAARTRRDEEPFDAARALARRMGARWCDDHVELGFWVPELRERGVPQDAVGLEVLDLPADTDPSLPENRVTARRYELPVVLDEEYVWVAVRGMRPGSRGLLGSLYRLVYRAREADGRRRTHVVGDPLAASLPFGGLAPAELYDVASLHTDRGDTAYWEDLRASAGGAGADPVRIGPPGNILQLHVPTATPEGTLRALAQELTALGRAQRAGTPLSPRQQLLAGYDALQPLPLEPTIEYELGPRFLQRVDDGGPDAAEQTLLLRRPDMTNWGYDILLSGSAATNARLLGSGRPDELVDLAVALHTLPRPMRLVIDVVYGHTDNQALPVLSPLWFRGANMYGQDVNQQHPVVRALVLEMQRRKVDHGADGVRVDGAQDFTTWDAEQNVVAHDDDFLALMSQVPQQVAGVAYRPWFVFEDGRPWPREDWPTASTYRAVIDRQPEAFQWGPLTFAHNTPALQGFWQERWWRVEEILTSGSHWVSGCANHDTVRRGTQIPLDAPVNPALGDSRPEVLANAYDNPAAQLLTYAAFPGVPMDFLNATARAPWAFVRNTDDRYGVKVVAEEHLFLWWQVDEERWRRLSAFPRLRALGIEDLASARRTFAALALAVEAAGDDLVGVVDRLTALPSPLAGPLDSVAGLKALARAYMDDVEELCQVHRGADRLDVARVDFAHRVREFRRDRPWLREDLAVGAGLDGRSAGTDRWGRDESEGALLVHVLRSSPRGDEQVLVVVNLAGVPVTAGPAGLAAVEPDGWQVALSWPGLPARLDGPLTLADSDGVVLVRATP